MLPLRARPQIDLPDEVVTLPELLLPETGTSSPSPDPVPTPPITPSFTVHDIRGMLPRKNENRVDNVPTLKRSLTFHWEGSSVIEPMSIDGHVIWLQGVARYHIAKDWGGGAFGDGIMYHEAIGQNGDSYLMRDYEEVVWHAGNGEGNRTSRAILVVCSQRTAPNALQLSAIRKRINDFGNPPAYPHGPHWYNTACPGDDIRAALS